MLFSGGTYYHHFHTWISKTLVKMIKKYILWTLNSLLLFRRLGESVMCFTVSGVGTLEQGMFEQEGILSNLNTSDSMMRVLGVCGIRKLVKKINVRNELRELWVKEIERKWSEKISQMCVINIKNNFKMALVSSWIAQCKFYRIFIRCHGNKVHFYVHYELYTNTHLPC